MWIWRAIKSLQRLACLLEEKGNGRRNPGYGRSLQHWTEERKRDCVYPGLENQGRAPASRGVRDQVTSEHRQGPSTLWQAVAMGLPGSEGSGMLLAVALWKSWPAPLAVVPEGRSAHLSHPLLERHQPTLGNQFLASAQ